MYRYATGISAAVAIVERVLDEGEPAADDYRKALRLGGRECPIESALAVYGDYLDEVAALL